MAEATKPVREVKIAELAVKAARLAGPVFAANDWKWGREAEDMVVPDENRIAETVSRLLHNVQGRSEHSTGTGRFNVYCEIDGQGVESLYVSLDLLDVSGETDVC